MRAVNLLPCEEKQPRKRLSGVAQVAIVSPILVGSLLAALYLLASSKVNDNKTTLRQLQDEVTALPAPVSQPPVNPQLAVEREQRLAALSAALQGRMAWDRILREVSAVLPSDVWLSTLTATAPTAAPEGATGSTSTPPTLGTPLSLAGYTYSQEGVARLLSRLAIVPDLQGVKLVQSAETTLSGSSVVSFSITASVRPQVTG